METHGRDTNLRSKNPATRRRIILFPLPFQGHINPMLQLASILHTQGFKITIIHTEYNSPNPSNYPHFTFNSISDRFHEIQHHMPEDADASFYLKYLNRSCVIPFRDCLARLLLAESGKEYPVSCIITDAGFYFTQAVADALKIPRVVLRTSSLASALVYGGLTSFSEKGYFAIKKEDPNYEALVPEYPFMKVKDIAKITTNPQGFMDLIINIAKETKASSGIISNTFKELEQPAMETIYQNHRIPSFILGPFHKYFSSSISSLIEQDRNILKWLDTKPHKSVVYVSFGSLAHILESEFQEMAHGLANTGLPFLWVVRPGFITGSEWLESLPEMFLESVGGRGRIVKWCPQQEVLAHPATGCFWTHSGWNSTMESICEGVPMICSPCFTDQPINARFVSDVWKIGVLLENGFERVGIEMAIRRVMMDKEEGMRGNISCLKEKINLSLKEGGSSYRSLECLVEYILSF